MKVRAALVVIAFLQSLAVSLSGQESIHVDEPVVPRYQAYRAEDLAKEITIRSSRSYAGFGYNTPEIVVQLPKADNGIYASIRFDEPILLDGSGAAVEFVREDGLLEDDTFTYDLRMVDSEGSPVGYARATGRVRIDYPSKIRTHRVEAGKKSDRNVKVEGRTVTFPVSDDLPEDQTYSSLEPIRAYDRSGRQLVTVDVTSQWDDGEVRTLTFGADVAAVEIDLVEEWTGLSIEYDLPASPLREAGLEGTVADPDPLLASTPAGSAKVELVPVLPRSVAGDAAEYSSDLVAELLASHGYREANGEAMVRAATESNLEAVRLLLVSGVPADAPSGGMTALLAAASFAEPDVIELLIRAGANVNAANEHGASVLIQLSNRCSMAEVEPSARLLIDSGADVNAKAAGGATALMMADVLQCADLSAMLREAGARPWQ